MATPPSPSSYSVDDTVEEFTADQVANKLSLEPSVVEWVKAQPDGPDEDPQLVLLVLEFQPAFKEFANFLERKPALTTLLLQQGALAVADSDRVFKFVDRSALFAARGHILNAEPDLFHQAPNGRSAYWVDDVVGYVLFSKVPKIRTNVITSGLEIGHFQVDQFQFFQT